MSIVTKQDAFDQQDPNTIPHQTTFDQQVSILFSGFQLQIKHGCQDLVFRLETLATVTFT